MRNLREAWSAASSWVSCCTQSPAQQPIYCLLVICDKLGCICQSKDWNISISCEQKKRSKGKIFLALFIFVSLLWGFCLYKLSLWWKDLTESALVLCGPGFHVVEHVGSWHFWIQEWILELCWNSCVNNNSSCCSSWHSNNSYACSCDSNRNHRKARNTFGLRTRCWLECSDYIYVAEDSLLEQLAT